MSEPTARFGDLDQLGLPDVLIGDVARGEASYDRLFKPEDDQTEREDTHDAAVHLFLQDQLWRAQRDPARREGVDPLNPRTFVETPEEMGERMARAEDDEMAVAERRRKLETGELHLLNIPSSELSAPPPSTEELETQRADLAIQSAGYRTGHASLVSRIRHALKGKGATS